MNEKQVRLQLGAPARYQIQIQGLLNQGWEDHFDDMTLTAEVGSATTMLEGVLPDQAALFGLLLQIRDLGLPLLLVMWMGEG